MVFITGGDGYVREDKPFGGRSDVQIAETVTFGGSGLERVAELRGDVQALARLWQHAGARVLLLWRGKCLVDEQAPGQLLWLPAQAKLIAALGAQAVFLGRDDRGAFFALDMSDLWEFEPPSDPDSFLDTAHQQLPQLPPGQVFVELRVLMSGLSARDCELAAMARAVFSWHESHRFCARCGAPSHMTDGGWQRRCDSCGASHFPRTDPVVIMLVTAGNKVLVGRSPGWPAGMYSLLAGFVEPGETIEAAVRREVAEETGVRIGRVAYLASQPWPFPTSLMIGAWGEALSQEIVIDPQEIEDACWLGREEVMEVFAGTHPRILPPRAGAIATFLLENWLADQLD